MKTARIELWIWVLIYLGMVAIGLGWSVQRSDESLGWGIAIVGAALVIAGALMVWIRSRMTADPTPTEKGTP